MRLESDSLALLADPANLRARLVGSARRVLLSESSHRRLGDASSPVLGDDEGPGSSHKLQLDNFLPEDMESDDASPSGHQQHISVHVHNTPIAVSWYHLRNC